jgi:hypothetical protein
MMMQQREAVAAGGGVAAGTAPVVRLERAAVLLRLPSFTAADASSRGGELFEDGGWE